MAFKLDRITILNISLLLLSLILLGLCLAEIVLEQNVISVFRDYKVQYQGSSMAEWMFVSLNPVYIDSGPTMAVTIAGAVGTVAAVMVSVWVAIVWWGVSPRTVSSVSVFLQPTRS